MLRAIGWIFLGIIGLPVAWLGSALAYETWHTYTYRYRLTVEVEVDGKVYIGSGVRQASLGRKATWIPQSRGASRGSRGEAIVVDLGEHGKLFALMKGVTSQGNADRIVLEAFPASPNVVTISTENMGRYKETNLKAELGPNQYPLIVRFRDINDPSTVELVDLSTSAKLSPGEPRLRQITLETTRDAVTFGLGKILLWFDEWQKRGGTLSGQIIFYPPTPPEALLIPSDFAK
jgi:hypothetical protein